MTRRRLRFALAVTLLFFCVHLVLDADALAQGTAPPALGTVSLVAGADTLALDAGTLTLRAASPALGAAPPAPGAALLVAGTSPPALGAAPLSAGTDTLSEPGFPDGWWAPTIGPGKGHWDLRVGVHAWTDHIELRNLRLRGLIDLGPGLRALAVVRSNSDVAGITTVAPRIDELYLEKYGYYTRGAHRLSLSLRLGVLRYLRFPYPDIISTFDQVPGIADLQGTHPTGYGGLVATAEYEHASGLGAHFTAIKWGFGYPGRHDLIEGYGFYRTQLGPSTLSCGREFWRCARNRWAKARPATTCTWAIATRNGRPACCMRSSKANRCGRASWCASPFPIRGKASRLQATLGGPMGTFTGATCP